MIQDILRTQLCVNYTEINGGAKLLTFQDFEEARESGEYLSFISKAINEHRGTKEYKIACSADNYDRQLNEFIIDFSEKWFEDKAEKSQTALCNNLYHRLNTQRCTYSLGNGISFAKDEENENAPDPKTKLGEDVDEVLFEGAYNALKHKSTYFFFNLNRVINFTLREFVPFKDEETGELRAGIRFWQIDANKPCYAVVYEEDGYTKYKGNTGYGDFKEAEEKRAYKINKTVSKALGEKIIGSENYSSFPIVEMYGTRLEQSTLVGMKRKLDAYDLIQSGFANNVLNVQQIYWLVENAGGMKAKDFKEFRENLMEYKMATVNGIEDGVKVTPHQNEVPTNAHETALRELRSSIYEDFGGFDVHTIAAGATNDHIEAAYQPMDENADDFEYQIIGVVKKLLVLAGEKPLTALFKRNRVANQSEKTAMVMSAAAVLDDEAIIDHLDFITVDEKEAIKQRKADVDMSRFGNVPNETTIEDDVA